MGNQFDKKRYHFPHTHTFRAAHISHTPHMNVNVTRMWASNQLNQSVNRIRLHI